MERPIGDLEDGVDFGGALGGLELQLPFDLYPVKGG
jgi:hypothetical protein